MYQIKLLLSLILLFFESMYFRIEIEFIPPQESACSFRERGREVTKTPTRMKQCN